MTNADKSWIIVTIDSIFAQKGVAFLAFYYCLLFDVDGTLLDFNAAEDGAFGYAGAFSPAKHRGCVSQYHDINNALWAALEQGRYGRTSLLSSALKSCSLRLACRAIPWRSTIIT
ncbi:MAG: hypothetical protein ACLRZH_07315 [Ruthenibacterium lactatiformans]